MFLSRSMTSTKNVYRRFPNVQFNRHEWAGSFGDIGTDLPLILGMLLVSDLPAASVLIVFGLLQIMTGLLYGLPMPMQPLKAMAVLIITQKVTGDLIYAAGLTIGLVMLLLTVSGLLERLAKAIPECVVRGIQFGLGLKLASLALVSYVPSMAMPGYVMAGIGFLVMLIFWRSKTVPAGLLLIAVGAVYAVFTGIPLDTIGAGVAIHYPHWQIPDFDLIWSAFVLLVLPQLPLSISNSVIATEKTVKDLFPERPVSIRKIGLTYSAVNILAPFFGGIPVCHGCGGLAGHYAFGARTGGSVVIYGLFYIVLGLFFSGVLNEVLQVFPQPILGVVLLFESLTLLSLIRDQATNPRNLLIALLVGVIALTLQQGFLCGLIIGSLVYYGFSQFGETTGRASR